MRPLSFLTALVLLATAKAQSLDHNPLLEAAKHIGAGGLGPATLNDPSATHFTREGGHPVVTEFVAQFTKDETKRAALEKGILSVIDTYEKGMAKNGMPNDDAAALAFGIEEIAAYDQGKPVDPTAFHSLIPRIRAVLAKTHATNAQKQEFYDYVLSGTGMVLVLGGAASDDAGKAQVKSFAEALLTSLVGVGSDSLALNEGKEAEAPPSPTSTESKVTKADLVGEWRWTSTGMMVNWDTRTGKYSGPGRAFSQHYVFRPDGTFKHDTYIMVNNGAHHTSAFVATEGRYEIQGGNLKIVTVKGHNHGEDNIDSSANYDRPTSPEALKRLSETFRFEMRNQGGKRALVLLLGKSPQDDMVFFPEVPSK